MGDRGGGGGEREGGGGRDGLKEGGRSARVSVREDVLAADKPASAAAR